METQTLHQNKVLVLDLDDTCFNMREVLYQSLKGYTGKDIHWQQWHQFYLPALYGNTIDEFFAVWQKDKVIENCTLEPGLVEFLCQAKAMGLDIHALSARGWHPKGYELTCDFIEKHDLPFDGVHIVDHSKTKAEYIQSTFDDVHSFVDDNFDHYHLATEKGINSYLINRPWNQKYQAKCSSHRIDSLNSLILK